MCLTEVAEVALLVLGDFSFSKVSCGSKLLYMNTTGGEELGATEDMRCGFNDVSC